MEKRESFNINLYFFLKWVSSLPNMKRMGDFKKKSGDRMGLTTLVAIIVVLAVVFGLFGSKNRDK